MITAAMLANPAGEGAVMVVSPTGCRAATWDDKRSIGAFIGEMNVPAVRPSATVTEKKKPVKAVPPAAGNTAPVF